MTTPYTPKVGDILTGVDARGVRGPAPVTRPANDIDVFTVRFDFPHVAGSQKEWMPGYHWRVQPDGAVCGTAMRVLFEPWQEPAAEVASATDDLVDRFAAALKEKLRAAEAKYGYNDGWLRDDWQDDLAADLLVHVRKGDPRDVAAYCAFAWHHGWSVARDTDNWSRPAPKLTTIGDIAGTVKPGTVVAAHLVVGDIGASGQVYPLQLIEEGGGETIWPHRDTPCTIISEPEPEPWKAGDEADYYGARVHIIHAEDAEAWVRWPGGNAVVLLSELERPQ